MTRFLIEAGVLIWPIFFLVLVIGLLVLWNLLSLLIPAMRSPVRRRQSINGVLFWGGVAAVLGFLGQWIGIHRIAQAVAARGMVNPQAVAHGISESLLTPVAGMAVLIAAALLWSVLRLGLWVVERRVAGG